MVMMNVVAEKRADADELAKRPRHQPKLGRFIYLLTTMAVIGGFLFGYDTGIVSSAMLFVPDNRDLYPMSNLWKEVIVAITPGMAAVGSLLAGPASDRFGRRPVIVVSSLIFAAGALVCSIGLSKGILLVGRILLGIAIGFASMIVPIYVSESSPAHIRGFLVTGFQLMITLGLVMANIFAGGFSYIDPVNVGWRLMFGFAAVPALIQFVGFLFLPESPRWLFEHRGRKAADEVLCKIYNFDSAWVEFELEEIHTAHEEHVKMLKNSDVGSNSTEKHVLRRVLTTQPVRRALIIGCLIMMFQQLCGINTIMYYTGIIVQSAGVSDKSTTIWITVITAGVNFLATFIPLHLVERLGRRPLLLVSVFCVMVSALLISASFYAINRDSTIAMLDMHVAGTRDEAIVHCQNHANCDLCTTDESCGFCSYSFATIHHGYCFPVGNRSSEQANFFDRFSFHNELREWFKCATATRNIASTSAAASSAMPSDASSSGGFVWSENFCKTRFTMLPIIFMTLFLLSFAIGFAPLAWVLNSEFYPLWARGTCVSIATCTNWVFNLIVSLTFLSLNHALTKFGTFLLYAGATAIALVLFWFLVPETKGLELDEIEYLFMSKRARKQHSQRQQQMAMSDLRMKRDEQQQSKH